MRKARRFLPIVLPALAILGLLAVAGHAGKPAPVWPTTVEVTGGIEILPSGTGDPRQVRVEFADSSIVIPRSGPDCATGREFISNPDYSHSPPMPPDTPSLSVTGTSANKTLGYFYCAHNVHEGTGELRCAFPADHADYYYCLVLLGGKLQKTGAVVFSKDCGWEIRKKQNPEDRITYGKLSTPVTYKVIR